MKFNTLATKVEQNTGIEKISKRMAYHQAGYAAAIHLGNQQKQLPPVHFQVAIKPQALDKEATHLLAGIVEGILSKFTVKVEGGRLIQSLPTWFSEALENLSWYQQAEYRCAFEADVTNLLAGSLAEAKYIALRDGEAFSANLVNLKALHFYTDRSDIDLINKYMASYLFDETEREQKLAELFLAAFRFVEKKGIWRKISTLAEFIQRQTKATVIQCEELISLLDSGELVDKAYLLDMQKMEFC